MIVSVHWPMYNQWPTQSRQVAAEVELFFGTAKALKTLNQDNMSMHSKTGNIRANFK